MFYRDKMANVHVSQSKLDRAIDRLVQKECSKSGTNKFINKIHPEVPFRYNSLNICVGPQGSGKTAVFMRAMIKMFELNPQNYYHLILYVTDNEHDDTFDSLYKYIPISIAKVAYEDLIPAFNEIEKAKGIYMEMLKDKSLRQNKALVDDVLQTLCLEDFSNKQPQTMIFCDDAVFIFDDSKQSKIAVEFTKIMCRLRHLQMTFWLNVQLWKSINSKIKSQVSGVFLCGGFSKQQMQYIYRQISTPVEFNQFYGLYLTLQKYRVLFVDCRGSTMQIL